MDSTKLGYDAGATADDGTCIDPVPGCTHPQAANLDTQANVDDGTCRFNIPGCTDPQALNFFALADVDDGSCIYAGCTLSSAPNFDPRAVLDDGSCQPRVEGCLNSTAINYLQIANVGVESMCLFAGCTNLSAKNYQSWVHVDDGSCIPYIYGCRDSTAANYASDAEKDSTCLYYGCIHSMALNFDPSANVDDGSCKYIETTGTIASFGYLGDCKVFVDGFGEGFSPTGTRDQGVDPYAGSSDVGHYSVVYRDPGTVNVEPSDSRCENRDNCFRGYACTDSVTGASLEAPLRTLLNATMATPLTTVAVQLISSTQNGTSLDANPAFIFTPPASPSFDEASASSLVCEHLVPKIACASSFQPCDEETGYADTCTEDGEPIDVFHFDALNKYLLGMLPDPAWSAWLVAQINTIFSVSCVQNALMCASEDLCGDCEANCVAEGFSVGGYSKQAVGHAIFLSLAEMILSGPANLEDLYGSGVANLIDRTAERLGVEPKNAQAICLSCGMNNFLTFSALTNSMAGRRQLDVHSPPEHLPEYEYASQDDGADLAARPHPDTLDLTSHASTVASRVCSALQPAGGDCHTRLALALARLPSPAGTALALDPPPSLALLAPPAASPGDRSTTVDASPGSLASANSASPRSPWPLAIGCASLLCAAGAILLLVRRRSGLPRVAKGSLPVVPRPIAADTTSMPHSPSSDGSAVERGGTSPPSSVERGTSPHMPRPRRASADDVRARRSPRHPHHLPRGLLRRFSADDMPTHAPTLPMASYRATRHMASAGSARDGPTNGSTEGPTDGLMPEAALPPHRLPAEHGGRQEPTAPQEASQASRLNLAAGVPRPTRVPLRRLASSWPACPLLPAALSPRTPPSRQGFLGLPQPVPQPSKPPSPFPPPSPPASPPPPSPPPQAPPSSPPSRPPPPSSPPQPVLQLLPPLPHKHSMPPSSHPPLSEQLSRLGLPRLRRQRRLTERAMPTLGPPAPLPSASASASSPASATSTAPLPAECNPPQACESTPSPPASPLSPPEPSESDVLR